MKEVRVVICGDQGVGKSSLISALIQEDNVTAIPKVFPIISIPPDPKLNDDVSLVLVDTQSGSNERDYLASQLRKANVLCLVYSDNYSYERVSIFWLPYFRSLGINVPIVLCANKSEDLDNYQGLHSIEHEMVPLINEFKEIESCILCSALEKVNVNELFYICRSCVIYPIIPLWDTKEKKLKSVAVDALSRIFFLSDKNNDDLLSTEELAHLSEKCFGKQLSKEEAEDIINTVQEVFPNGVTNGQLNRAGFLAYNQLQIENGKQESTWGILRAFHYTDSLCLDDSYLSPKLEVAPGQSVELSPKGYRFLVDLFYQFDRDNDGALNDDELSDLFRYTPGLPETWIHSKFPNSTVLNEHGFASYNGWLAQWSMITLFDYKTTLAYLAYLGFDSEGRGHVTDALKVTKKRSIQHRRVSKYDRNVFLCFVVGSAGCGKTSLLSSFINKIPHRVSDDLIPNTVVNSVEFQSRQRYLVLSEIGEKDIDILAEPKSLDACDVLCLLYDSSNPNSFSFIANLLGRYPALQKIPCVFAATKADLDRQQQRYPVQPDEFTKQLSLPSPTHISTSAIWNTSKDFFIQIAESAQFPANSIIQIPDKNSNKINYQLVVALTAFGALLLSVGGSLAWKIVKYRNMFKR
ncbi:GTPase Gem1 [Schizosaccharomyces octosporus yFS286]|uniref:Mitochondrial Rho GTPase n=1 Tax=Schizosaccharomyces octosporus (strain yFS286) TaxID=483514 RepID=S9PUU8_SCHOY|nr:GTPase Gem1 [Schizosaccharomyces octosporus yFS286]EPX71767.1 GTPase Gem1 [Schizosaccharomyces octosporus yFS286]